MGLSPATSTFGNNGLLSSTPVTLYPSRLSRSRTDSRSLFFLIPSLSSTSEAGGQLSSSQRALVAGSFACLPLPCAPLPVSPLPCLRSDTVWLVLWLVTALQGPCQRFVLRESAGLALFRSLTVPLLGSVPSRCRCFTLLTPLACFLWLFVVSCGTGWASTSVDNL